MKEVIDKALVPFGGYYNYLDPDSGAKFKHPYYNELLNMATKHRQVNNFSMGADWELIFGDNVCTNTPSAPCGETYSQAVLAKMSRFAVAMVRWARSGFAVVTEEQYQARLSTCQSCEHFTGNADGTFTAACRACGCSGKKLYVSSEACPKGKWNAI